MIGKFTHEDVILDPLEQAFRELGATTGRQARIHSAGPTRYADLLVVQGEIRGVIEAEMCARRVPNDLRKALDLRATFLWIVVPNRRVAGAVRRRLARLGVREARPWLCVLTVGQALEWVTKNGSLFSPLKVGGKTNTDSAGAPPACAEGILPHRHADESEHETEGTVNGG